MKAQNGQGLESKETLPRAEDAIYPADALSTARKILFTGTLCTAMFTTQIGLANTLTTVGVIGDSFHMTNQGQISWLIAGYSLTIGTFIIIGGRLGDEFGNKRLFVLGMAWYSLWSMIAGLAVFSSPVLFIFARVFQGVGPALTLPNGLAILGSSFSPANRNMAFAWFGAAAPFGALAGFTCGGIFGQLLWWPWIYWSQAIALGFVAFFAAWAIPKQPEHSAGTKNRTRAQKIDDLDIPGMITGVLAIVLINFAWNQSTVVTWTRTYVYVCLILGFIFGAAFLCIEIYWAKHPILPLKVFNMDIAFVFACTSLGWACFGIWVLYICLVAQTIGTNSPLQMAAWFVPIIPSGLMSALTVGKLVGKVPASWIMVVGQTAYFVGSILAAARPPDSIYWTFFFFSVLIICVGMDTSFPSAAMIFASAVPQKYQGMAASIVMTVVNYSISLGIGFAGTLETNINNNGLTKNDQLRGYQGAMWLSVGLSGLGLVLSLIYVWIDTRRTIGVNKAKPDVDLEVSK